jgi:hypothetical protein
MRTSKFTIAIAALVTLAGCATTYQAPASGPTAAVRIIAINPNNHFIKVAGNKSCLSDEGEKVATLGVNAATAPFDNGIGKKVGMPPAKISLPDQTTEIRVPAETVVAVQASAVNVTGIILGAGPTYAYCKSGLKFSPRAGASYEVIFDQTELRECRARLYFLQELPDGQVDRVMQSAESLPVCK